MEIALVLIVAACSLLSLWVFRSRQPPELPLLPPDAILRPTLTIRSDGTAERGVQRVDAKDENAICKHFSKGNATCPDCGGKLLAGPSGGMTQNCLCEDCHAEFNAMIGGPFSERLAPPGEGRKHIYGVS
jgi:hypothetical protein